MALYDLHAHFLPKIDDGAQSSEIAVEMLAYAAEQGVDVIAATSHYYSDRRSISEFLSARELSFARVKSKIDEKGIRCPSIILGAEVYLTRGLSLRDDLEKLCYEGTNLLLLELPYDTWGSWVYREVERIISNCAIKVVLAHPERYLAMRWDKKKLFPFEEMGVIFQLNADDILEHKRIVGSLLESGCQCVLGSDTHNMAERKNRMREAVIRLERVYGKGLLLDIENYVQYQWRL